MRATVSRQTEAARRRVRGLEIGMTMNERGGRKYQHGNRHEWRYRTGYTPQAHNRPRVLQSLRRIVYLSTRLLSVFHVTVAHKARLTGLGTFREV
jgi:hypothetical protein